MATTRTSISVIGGFFSTSNEVTTYFHPIFLVGEGRINGCVIHIDKMLTDENRD